MADALAEAAKQIAALQKKVRKLQARNTPSVYMGWTNIPVQPTYISATSMLFTGIDLTTHLKSYIKCRFYQSGWRYGYVSSSSLGSGNTTAVILGNTVLNAAITNFSISYGNPVDFPASFVYTSAVAGSSGSAGTYAEDNVTSNYSISSRTVSALVTKRITNLGSWSGTLQISLPVVPVGETVGSWCGFEIATGAAVPRAYAILQTFYYVRFMTGFNSSFLQFSGMAANDWIHLRCFYRV